MGFLIIVGIVIFFVVIGNLNKDNEQQLSTSAPASKPQVQRFEARVKKGQKQLEGTSVPVLNVGVRGPLSVPHDNYSTRVRCELVDITDKEPLPLLVMIEVLQAADSTMFLYEAEGPTLPYSESVMPDWLDWLSLPHEFLVFPRSGVRKLQVVVTVLDKAGQRRIASAKTTMSMIVTEKGYLEEHEDRKKVRELTLELAMAVSAADGDLASEESTLIKHWVRARTKQAGGGSDAAEVAALNRVIRKAYSDLMEGDGIKLHEVCESLTETASTAEKYDALELCVRLAGADEVAEVEEMEVLQSIAEWLGIKEEKLRAFVDKHLPVTIHASHNVQQLLGLRDDMSIHEKKKVLRKVYRHWNGMVAHSDPEKRRQAEEMLGLIAEERAKLNKANEVEV